MSIAAFTKPLERKLRDTTVKLIREDLTALPVDAFVFYAREDLDIGTGYGTAIQMRAGLAVKKELAEIGSISMGDAVITTAGEMNCEKIIHACGPKHLERDLQSKLTRCMDNTLKLANFEKLKSIAFPPMGTGFYGVPLAMSANVMFSSIKKAVDAGTTLEEIIICTIDKRDFNAFADKMKTF